MTEKTLPMDPRQINSPQSFGEFLQEQNAMGQFTTVVVDPRNIFFDSFPDQETAEHTPLQLFNPQVLLQGLGPGRYCQLVRVHRSRR